MIPGAANGFEPAATEFAHEATPILTPLAGPSYPTCEMGKLAALG